MGNGNLVKSRRSAIRVSSGRNRTAISDGDASAEQYGAERRLARILPALDPAGHDCPSCSVQSTEAPSPWRSWRLHRQGDQSTCGATFGYLPPHHGKLSDPNLSPIRPGASNALCLRHDVSSQHGPWLSRCSGSVQATELDFRHPIRISVRVCGQLFRNRPSEAPQRRPRAGIRRDRTSLGGECELFFPLYGSANFLDFKAIDLGQKFRGVASSVQ